MVGGGPRPAALGAVDQIGVSSLGSGEVPGPVGGQEQRLELAAEVVGQLMADPVGVAGGPVHAPAQVPQAALHGHAGEDLAGQGRTAPPRRRPGPAPGAPRPAPRP